MEADNLKKYAEQNGLDPEEAGEVIFAAAESRLIGDVYQEHLMALGIRSQDSKTEVVAKVREALKDPSANKKLNKLYDYLRKPYPDGVATKDEAFMMAEDAVRRDLNGVLSWLGEKE